MLVQHFGPPGTVPVQYLLGFGLAGQSWTVPDSRPDSLEQSRTVGQTVSRTVPGQDYLEIQGLFETPWGWDYLGLFGGLLGTIGDYLGLF